MKNKIENYKYFDIIIVLAIIVSSYFIMSIVSDYIGLYYDAVNPDHLAPFILNKVKEGTNIFDLIYLGQVYHGVFNSYVMAFLIEVVGAPSASLLHFTSATYSSIICIMIYKILRKCKVDKLLSAFICVLTSLSTALLCINITQFYVELSGMVFEIIGISIFIDYLKTNNIKKLLLVGLFSGLACYGYYNYAFFIPAFIIIIIIHNIKNKNNIINSIMIYIPGILLGVLPYILGYSQRVFGESSHKYLIYSSILLFMIIWIIYTYKVFQKDNKKKKIISIIILIGIITFCILSYSSLLLTSLEAKSSNVNIGFFEKITRLFDKYFGLVNSSTVEQRLFNKILFSTKNIINYISAFLFIFSVVISFIRYRRNKIKNNKILYLFILVFVYFVLAFFISLSGLSEQHFVPMLFINSIVLSISINYLISLINNDKIKNIVKIIFYLFIMIGIGLNIYGNKLVVSNLYKTGGQNGAFSTKINDISYDALDDKGRGIKDYYVFKEWGYDASFRYLTNESIPHIEDINNNIKTKDILDNYIEDYQIIMICQNENTKNSIINELDEYGDSINYSIKTIYERNGSLAYYKIVINNK